MTRFGGFYVGHHTDRSGSRRENALLSLKDMFPGDSKRLAFQGITAAAEGTTVQIKTFQDHGFRAVIHVRKGESAPPPVEGAGVYCVSIRITRLDGSPTIGAQRADETRNNIRPACGVEFNDEAVLRHAERLARTRISGLLNARV